MGPALQPRRLGSDERTQERRGAGLWGCPSAHGWVCAVLDFRLAVTALCKLGLSGVPGHFSEPEARLSPGPGARGQGLSVALCLRRVHCQLVRLFARGIEESPKQESRG